LSFFPDIEAQISVIQEKKTELAKTTAAAAGVGLLDSGGFFDSDLYDDDAAKGKGRYEGYNTSIAANDAEEVDEDEDDGFPVPQKRTTYTAPTSVLKDVTQGKEDVDPMADRRRPSAERHIFTVRSLEEVYISPDPPHRTAVTAFVCPAMFIKHWPSFTSQIRQSPSPLAEASFLHSGSR